MNASFVPHDPLIVAETAGLRVTAAAPAARLSLRARDGLAALSDALGVPLPGRIGARASRNGREALCLGPDEWVIVAPEADRLPLIEAAAASYAAVPHSLVDISDREVRYAVEGPEAATLLSLGCPRDLAALPAGEGRRTVFDGVSVVLWKDTPDRYALDVWRSFALHVESLLAVGAAEIAAEAATH